jgi:hypothetical protein
VTQPRQIAPDQLDPDVAEEWVRETAEPDVGNVGASRWAAGGNWPWQVWVAAAEFVRQDPLESTLRRRMVKELRAVTGVMDVAEEDREVWLVAGEPSGAELTRAAAAVVDELATLIREEMRRD